MNERTRELTSEVAAHQETSRDLRAAKEAAEAGSRAKSDFLATISHELRTPMHVILGMSGLALESARDSRQREHLKVLKESADSLLAIINNVLDISKIEAGKVVLLSEPFNLRDELEAALNSLDILARDKEVTLSWKIVPRTPGVLLGDRDRLRQIIINLVSNGIKFTTRGEVTVEVRCERRVSDRATLHFRVKDTGIGIPKEKLGKIFTAFEQAD
ncbi:MAG: hypothetical protein GWO24_35305, partial [Akkermansiaceae bacterium]|nr:hypothetical protein [Akkermansiaceae bacterium]